ncbi:unnamed protein product, partial [Owenia fusiformis]
MLWRLVNYLGYDIVTFDTDALPVHHPSDVFDRFPRADLIGSQNGRYPFSLVSYWQLRTINMGMVLMRSSLNKTIFWDMVGKVSVTKPDDQVVLNLALVCLNISWQHPPLRFIYTYPETKDRLLRYNEELNSGKVPIEGKTDYHLNVIGVQGHQVCRSSCSLKRLDDIIIWHGGGKFQQGLLWLLGTNWTMQGLLPGQHNRRIIAKGDEWL